MKDRRPGSKDFPEMSDAEKAEWERLFRENVRQLPETAEKWFGLSNLAEELVAREGIDVIVERLKKGENLDSSFQPSQDFTDYVALIANDINGLIHSGLAIKVPGYVEARLADAQQKFAGNESELKRVRSRLYYGRASAQGYLVEKGPFKQLPHGNKLRSLAVLSAGVDYMRGDIEFGSVTDYARAASECFGYAQMQVLQHRVTEKIFGAGVTLVYASTLRPIPRLSVPQDREIADLQRRVVNRLQRIM